MLKAQTKIARLTFTHLLIGLCLALVIFNSACKKDQATTGSGSQASGGSTSGGSSGGSNSGRPTDAKGALDLLIQGNERFANGNFAERQLDKARVAELAKSQNPFAVVLTCSDSQAVPELIFDQSLGDLFVVRIGGNVADKLAMGSIEYAVNRLKTPLIFVLGHDKCAAVAATSKNEGIEGNMVFIANEIKPAVTRAKSLGGDIVEKSIDENVRNTIDTMAAKSSLLDKLIKDGKIGIAGGTFNSTTGKVNIIHELTEAPAAPQQSTEAK